MTDLTELEHAVLTKLLAGDHPLLEEWRTQLASCRVSQREMTGAGFYAHFDTGDAPAAKDVTLRFGDVLAEVEGMAHGAGFVLYVEHGRLSMLEGYGYDDPWPSMIMAFTLKYNTDGERDWAALERLLG